jgi:hypothetical protein
MGKSTITKWWIFGAAAIGLAAILVIANALALADHLDAMSPGVSRGLVPDDVSRRMLVLIVLGGSIAAIGILTEFVAWIGALATAGRLADRRWFNALLRTGIAGTLSLPLFGLGAVVAGSAMLAYLVAGPDGTAIRRLPEAAAPARPTIWAKPTILRWSSWGLVPMGAGSVIAVLVSYQTRPGGLLHGHTWTTLTFLTTCAVAVVSGVIVESVSWWAAEFNTRQLLDQTWFKALAWTGLVGTVTLPLLGLGALILAAVGIAYRVAGPDALAVQQHPTHTPATA